jgi:dolichyl-diphosphooligosaccharide--protein glycosyltransferase
VTVGVCVVRYKLSYYRFGEAYSKKGEAAGYDRARKSEVGNAHFDLETVEEVFTSENWLFRVYKVKGAANRGATSWIE